MVMSVHALGVWFSVFGSYVHTTIRYYYQRKSIKQGFPLRTSEACIKRAKAWDASSDDITQLGTNCDVVDSIWERGYGLIGTRLTVPVAVAPGKCSPTPCVLNSKVSLLLFDHCTFMYKTSDTHEAPQNVLSLYCRNIIICAIAITSGIYHNSERHGNTNNKKCYSERHGNTNNKKCYSERHGNTNNIFPVRTM